MGGRRGAFSFVFVVVLIAGSEGGGGPAGAAAVLPPPARPPRPPPKKRFLGIKYPRGKTYEYTYVPRAGLFAERVEPYYF